MRTINASRLITTLVNRLLYLRRQASTAPARLRPIYVGQIHEIDRMMRTIAHDLGEALTEDRQALRTLAVAVARRWSNAREMMDRADSDEFRTKQKARMRTLGEVLDLIAAEVGKETVREWAGVEWYDADKR